MLYKKANQKFEEFQNIDEDSINRLSHSDIKAFLHDLSIYKIELEMQNDELIRTQQQLYEAKEYYMSLFDYAPIGYVIVNLNTEIKSINRWLLDFLNVQKSQTIGKKFSEFIFPEDQDPFYFLVRDAVKYKKYAQIEMRIGIQDKGYRWCLVDSKMIGNNEDEFFLSFVDIDHKVLAEKVLRFEKNKAENVNYAKSQFLANMSHEIRTPMNGMMGVLQLLEYTGLTAEQLELVEISKKSAFSLLNILNSILDYSKIEEKMVIFENLEFQLGDIIEDVKALFYPSIMDKKLNFCSSIGINVPTTLKGDSYRIKQILNNLVGNAIKFTSSGEIKLIVESFEHVNQEKIEIEFQVHDTGIGIAEQSIDSVFERFSQADSSNTRKYGGTGLGLAICKGLAEQMEGVINIDSREGIGTIVKFRVPLIAGQSNISPMKIKDEMKFDPLKMNSNRNIKLLIAEDDEVSRLVLYNFASSKGWNVETFSNGLDAVLRFEQSQFDLIIMDAQMPVLDGYSATTRIREIELLRGTRTPIIAITANALSGDKEKCIQAGMDDYLSKPLNFIDFYEMIDKWIKII